MVRRTGLDTLCRIDYFPAEVWIAGSPRGSSLLSEGAPYFRRARLFLCQILTPLKSVANKIFFSSDSCLMLLKGK